MLGFPQRLVGFLSLGDVFGNAQEIPGLALFVQNRNLLRMQDPASLMRRLDRFLRNIQDLSTLQDFGSPARKELGFRRREKIKIILAKELFPRPSEQLLARLVEAHK